MNNLSGDFPLLTKIINDHELVYFDNAATTPKPKAVIAALSEHYQINNGNPGRGTHSLALTASQIIENTRTSFLQFIDAPENYSTVFTKNATESLNMIAYYFADLVRKGEKITVITTQVEHHANFLPWLRLHKNKQISLEIAPVKNTGEINYESLALLVSEHPGAYIAITACSNVTGLCTDLEIISQLAQKYACKVLIDATQLLPHKMISLRQHKIDFLVASGHKLFAPEGVGMLVASKETLQQMEPQNIGGGMISQVSTTDYTFKTNEEKFEAGTPNTAGIAGLRAALRYIDTIGREDILTKEKILTQHFLQKLAEYKKFDPSVKLLSDEKNLDIPLFSLSLSLHPHDVADFLDNAGIAVRAGHHCAQPLHQALGVQHSIRASLSFYNTITEIDYFFTILQECKKKFA